MTRFLRRALERVRSGADAGIAMVFVIGTMTVVTLFVTAGLAYAVAATKTARGAQDFNAALAAAQAGIDDYIVHLNRADNYGRLPTFSDCTNTAMKGPSVGSNTCGWNSTTAIGWQQLVPGDAAKGSFHYDVNNLRLAETGVIDVTSTGRVGKETRTLQAAVGRGGSTEFLYYTNHEDADPENRVSYPNDDMNPDCYSYWYGPDPYAPSNARSPRKTYSQANRSGFAKCSEIQFGPQDDLDGKVHLNDTPQLSSGGSSNRPIFRQGFETSDPACKAVNVTNPVSSTFKSCDRSGVGTANNFPGGKFPRYADPLYLDDSSAAFANFPGCQYKGATRIKFSVVGGAGKMTVWSKNSTATTECGGNAPNGVTVDVPNDKVIYVQGDGKPVHQCLAGEIDGEWPLGNYNATGVGTNLASYTMDTAMQLPAQYCGQGNAYIEGTLQGRTTVATSNTITVLGDLELQNGLNGSDLLGLVAGNSLEVANPRVATYDCSKSTGTGTNKRCTEYKPTATSVTEITNYPKRYGANGAGTGVEINGSIQTLSHSFFVQNYNLGSDKGKLTVNGSIAQQWRGAVGTTANTGYAKDYNYDVRLKYSAPPYFPQFLNAKWTPRTTGEITPRYPAT